MLAGRRLVFGAPCSAVDAAGEGAALGATAGEARLRPVSAEAGYTRVCRVATEAAPLNIVREARP
jgi:hypothetical protein